MNRPAPTAPAHSAQMKPYPTLLITAVALALLCGTSYARTTEHAAYCAGMYRCLQEMPKGCSEQECTQTDIPENDSYCALFRELKQRGLSSTSRLERQIYRQVSGRHCVEYALTGRLPMPADVMVYLMNDLPFSAQLVNAYQKTAYTAAYLDSSRRRFSASSESVSGVFTTVLQNEQQTGSLYYGFGTVEILAWRLSGTALILLDFEETAMQEITYTVRCLVFPHSAFVKSILNFILFRKAVIGVLDRTFSSIQDSAMAFHRGERAPIADYPAFQTPEGRQQIEAFRAVLLRTMPEAYPPRNPQTGRAPSTQP